MVDDLHVSELIPAYALDCLEADEARLVGEHLVGCELCRAELRSYQEVAGQLAFALPQVEPPEALKVALMKRLVVVPGKPKIAKGGAPWWKRKFRPAVQLPAERGTAGQRGWLPSLAPAWAIAGLVVILVLGASNVLLWQQMRDLRAIQPAAPLRVVALTGSQVAPTASGLIVISKDGRHGTLVVDELPALDEARQYHKLIRDGRRTSEAVFSVGGWVRFNIGIITQPLIDYSSLITIEPPRAVRGQQR
jgi:anti-sigma factor RsiW